MVGRIGWVSCCLFLIGAVVFAKTPEQRQADTLRALPGVYFIVENVSPAAEADGLTTDQIRRDIELQLRRAGIHIMSEAEWSRTPGKPFLYARVSLAKSGPRYAYHLEVQLLQRVKLERYLELPPVQVPTWSAPEEIGVIDAEQLQHVRRYLADQMARFITAYLAVNTI